jgi:flagellar hook-basal body complex protein FliE
MDISSISPIRATQITNPSQPVQPAGAADKVAQSFGDVLNSLNQSQQTSDQLVSQLASGENVDLHNLMIAAEENDINFRVTMAIRDHLVDAYREVMRMSV